MTNEEERLAKLCLELITKVLSSEDNKFVRIQACNVAACYLLGDEFNWDEHMLERYKVEAAENNFDVCIRTAKSLRESIDKIVH